MIKVSVAKVALRWNPFREPIWVKLDRPITREEIAACPVDGKYPTGDRRMDLIWDVSSRKNHIERVAWLAGHWSDDYPIGIDVGCCVGGMQAGFEILDGNHRLAAALYLRKRWIWAEVSGQVDWIEQITWKGRVPS